MSAPVEITIRANLGLVPNQLRCLTAIADASIGHLDRSIECDALEAFGEIQHMVDAAHRELGTPKPDSTIGIRCEVEVKRSGHSIESDPLARAVRAYDRAIRACDDDPYKMASFCTAEGDDLDALYYAMLNLAHNPR